MWNKLKIVSTLLVGLLLFFSGCKSVSLMKKKKLSATMSYYVDKQEKQATTFSSFQSKVKVALKFNKKKFQSNGVLKVKKDEWLQLSLQPFLGIEVFRLEVTPKEILIIDRLHKRYIQEPTRKLKKEWRSVANFNNLQALFFNQLFVTDFSEATFSTSENRLIEHAKGYYKTFDFDTSNELTNSLVSNLDRTLFLDWQYEEFKQVDESLYFPCLHRLQLFFLEKASSGTITYKRVYLNRNLEKKTTISSNYKRVTLEQLMQQF